MKIQGRLLFLISALAVFAVGTASADEASARERRASVRRALTWLVKQVGSDKALASSTKSTNQAIATIMTALILEANPDFAEFDSVRRRIRDQADRLADPANLSKGLDFYLNWPQGFAALYAYERSLREGRPHPALDRIARGFVERQNVEGGWRHGKGRLMIGLSPGPYPSTVIGATNLALFAFGVAEREKAPFCQKTEYKTARDRGLKLLHDVQGSSGAMPYGGMTYRWWFEVARTASTLVTLAALGRTDDAMFRRAADYVQRNLGNVPRGHGSTSIHVALGALASYILSEETWQRYDGLVLKHIRQKQAKDGSMDDKSIYGEMSNQMEGSVSPAAVYALALSMDRLEVARQLRLKTPLPPPSAEAKMPQPSLVPAWELDLADVVDLKADGDLVAVVRKDGTVTCLAVNTGQRLGTLRLPKKNAGVRLLDGKVFVLSTTQAAKGKSASQLFCYDPKQEKPLWQTDIAGNVTRWQLGHEQAVLQKPAGQVVLVSTAQGKADSFAVAKGLEAMLMGETSVQSMPDHCCALGGRYRLAVYDDHGHVLWEHRNDLREKVIPPAFWTFVASDGRLYAGRSDGSVECLELKTGKAIWRVGLKSSIAQIHLVATKPERLLAVDQEGVVYGIQDGKAVWQARVGNNVESDGRLNCILTAAGLVAKQGGCDRVLLVDLDGHVKELPSCKQHWSVANRWLITWSDGRIKTYALK